MTRKFKVLVAYDGSHCAHEAMKDLGCAGLPPETELLVVSVADAWMPARLSEFPEFATAPPTKGFHTAELVRKAIQQARTAVTQQFPSWTVQTVDGWGSASGELIKQAKTWQPNLIVVPAPPASTSLGFFFGTVPQIVILEAPCSVRIVRQCARRDRPFRLIIGLDGSPGADAAVQEVAIRNWPTGTKVRLVTSLEPAMAITNRQQAGAADSWAWIRQKLTVAEEYLRAAGLEVSVTLSKGNAKSLLLEEAKEWEADNIFVGAKGLNELWLFSLNSVTAAVVAHAHCSVEIVRPGR